MATFCRATWITRRAGAAASLSTLVAANALASQGPGTGPGTATSFTQLTMAVLVYGAAALVICAGLIGAVWRH